MEILTTGIAVDFDKKKIVVSKNNNNFLKTICILLRAQTHTHITIDIMCVFAKNIGSRKTYIASRKIGYKCYSFWVSGLLLLEFPEKHMQTFNTGGSISFWKG